MAGQLQRYELPRIREWNEGDEINVKIEISNEKLTKCNCIYVINRPMCEEESSQAKLDGCQVNGSEESVSVE